MKAMTFARFARVSLAIFLLFTITACGGGGNDSPPPPPSPTTYTVGGTVSGLTGFGLVLQKNGTDNRTVTANGAFTFAVELLPGAAYNVTVVTQPTNPGQTCTVTNGAGIVTSNVTNVSVVCTAATFTIGGAVSGLAGTGLVLRNNGGDNRSVSANGAFTFATALTSGSAYNVTVFTQPTSPAQTCSVTNGSGTVSASITNVAVNCTTTTIVVSGRVTFDLVPFRVGFQGLDYANVVESPARGVVVEAVDAVGRTNIIVSTSSNATGDYSLSVPVGISVFIRMKAQMRKDATAGSPASWDFSVRDNTNGNALYALNGADFTTAAASTRNLRATVAFSAGSYTDRRAAPFAILDDVYRSFNLVLSADATVVFPPLNLHWSVANRPVGGNVAIGDIGTSHYRKAAPQGIYILGLVNTDTDEYDRHVVVHEWGHYFQDKFSRSDSLGGSHGVGNRLDPRVSFGEGWGNAFSAMVLADPVYRDSTGSQQATDGVAFNVETAADSSPGWYGETTVQAVLYDFFDSAVDGADTVNLGFAPIWAVMTNEVRTTNAFATIFPFVTGLKTRNPGVALNIDSLLVPNGIVGSGNNDFGVSETNNGGDARNLPIYSVVGVPGQVSVTSTAVISTSPSTRYNKLGNRRFVTFTLNTARTTTISVTGPAGADPDVVLFRAGVEIGRAQLGGNDTLAAGLLQPGVYVVETYEFSNVDTNPNTARGDTAITVAIN